MLWDVFCTVIDNFGDIGVCWRLSRNLAARGQQVRLWVDDATALAWMASGATAGGPVAVGAWHDAQACVPGDVVVEAFGCELPAAFVQAMARCPAPPAWINLEYLTAEPYAARCHRLPSPVLSGPGQGLTKHFFYPGFTAGTGGLLREPDLLQRQAGFDRAPWLASLGLSSDVQPNDTVVTLFCYEPAALPGLLAHLQAQAALGPGRTHLLVTPGRATQAVRSEISGLLTSNQLSANDSLLSISYLSALSQDDFDHLLWASDLNFVRGEDSLVRALWAGKPLVWQIYPQSDDAHHAKLQAFLDTLDASPVLRQWHQAWNGNDAAPLPGLDGLLADRSVALARDQLLSQDDLAHQLQTFVARHGTARP